MKRKQIENPKSANILYCVIAFICLMLILAMICFSCTPKNIPIAPEIHYIHDTIKTVERHDSIVEHYIYEKDSSSFHQKGDTVTIEKWHWYRDYSYEKILEAKIDSFAHAERDSIPYAVEVPVYVGMKPTWWQRVRLDTYYILLGIIVLYILIKYRKGILSIIKSII